MFREINLSTDSVVQSFDDLTEFTRAIAGQRVLLLVHGYNNEQDEVYDAYSVIEDKVRTHMSHEYDEVIGYSWPGGDVGLEWWSSKRRANAVARRFRFLLRDISASVDSIDVMSHSLGARVVLKGLKQFHGGNDVATIRNYYCTAAAVDNEVLEAGEEFHDSVDKITSMFVFHSRKDGVLSYAYRAAEFDRPLGLSGPEDKAYVQRRTKNIFVVNCKKKIESHGAYKRSDDIYAYMASALTKKPPRFITL
jgi:esterase/lipase superfamily enzyme